jgi:hypothetical protein
MFFDQTFKIYFDDGRMVETNDLLAWLRAYPEGAEKFYYRMKWLCKYDKPVWESYSYYRLMYLECCDFYLYTSSGMMVSPELFKGEYKSHQYRVYGSWSDRIKNRRWRFQGHKSHSTTYDRYMETIAERRAVAAVIKEEGEPEFRGRRRNLPNPWDDIMARRSLSWKDCTKRKRQYKGS